MKYRRRIYYSAEQRAEIWDRWQRGESMSSIGWVFDRMGTYRPGFLVIATLMVVASGALLMASRPQLRVISSMESSNLRG